MKILYLSYDGMTDQLGQSQVLPYLIGLSEKGHQIHLISCEKPERFKKISVTIYQLIIGTGITWHPLKYHKNPPVISTLIDMMQIRSKAIELQQQIHFDIVHCRSYITSFTGMSLKKKSGLKFIFDMRGFYADERVDGKIWNLNNPVYAAIYRYFKRKEKQFLTNADFIISLTKTGEKIIQSWKLKGENKLPVAIIPCCADLKLFDYHKYNSEISNALREELNIRRDAFVLTYLGAIGTWYMLDDMLAFFKRLLLVKKEAIFLFITHEQPHLIGQHAKEKSIPNENLRIVAVQRNDVPLYLSVSNISIFFIMPSFSKSASSPTKQGELMGMGIPVICNAGVGDTDEITLMCQSGIVMTGFSDREFDVVINRIDEFKNLNREKIREGAKQFFSLEKGIEAYHNIYQSLKGI